MNFSNSNGHAPNLSLNLQGASAERAGPAPPVSSGSRPKSTPHAKAHKIVAKDYYRLMKSEKNVDKHLQRKST